MPTPRQGSLLIVDDMPANLKVLMDFLLRDGYKVLVARDGEEGLSIARQAEPELILLDIMMPGLDGLEVCRRIKADPAIRHIPVIFITALNDAEHKLGGFRAGGNDYITKPFHQEEVLARINTHLKVHRMKRQLRELNDELQTKNDTLSQTNLQLERQNESLKSMVEVLGRTKEAAEEEIRAKSEWLSGLSQEMRVPMQSVLGTSEALREMAGQIPVETTTENLGKIAESGKRMLALLNDVLDFSRIEAGQMKLYPEQFSVGELLGEIEASLAEHPHLKTTNTHHIEIDPKLGEMQADRGRVRQLLEDLLVNATRFTDAGTIRLQARREPRGETTWIQFEISDTGVGLSQEQKDKIHHPLMCGIISPPGEPMEGTGMELCLAKRLVDRMQGTLAIDSEPGEGTRIRVDLPAIAPVETA